MDGDHQTPQAKHGSGRVSFAGYHHLFPSSKKRISASRSEAKRVEHLSKGKSSLSNYIDVSESPLEDSEARTTDKPALDFLQLQTCSLPVPSTSLWVNELDLKEHIHEAKIDDDDGDCDDDGSNQTDGFPMSIQEPVLSYSTGDYTQRFKNLRVISHYVKAWLRRTPITDLTMELRQKRKDLQRARRAQVHAALSVVAVATAMASIAANSRSGNAAWDPAVAAAASLVAAACAEAAESTGANRSFMASLVDSAANLHSPADILKFTASAATYLSCIDCRGHLGKKRNRNHLSRHLQPQTPVSNKKSLQEPAIDQAALKRGIDLYVGFDAEKNTQLRNVSIYVNHNHLVVMRLTKKHFAVFKTSKEYEVADAPIKDEEKGLLYLKVKTKGGGTTSILFRDKKQRDIWESTIIDLLSNQKM